MDNVAPALWLPAALVAAVLLLALVRLVALRIVAGSDHGTEVVRYTYRPLQLIAAAGAGLGALAFDERFAWRAGASHVLLLTVIASAAWLATRVLYLLRRTAERAFVRRIGVSPDSHRRQRLTQLVVLYRTGYSALWMLAVGLSFITFPDARTLGTSLLASAGVAGVIVGLAAQAMLKNLFAGLSLAFGDAIRLGDVIEVDGEWGRIEDIALSYVVVKIWDERRLVLPTSYFNDYPHRNWSRGGTEVMGTVELDVDWRLPVEEVRTEVARIVSASRHWDRRWCTVLVTGSDGPMKRIRPLVSAADGDTLWSLRCELREKLIDWIVAKHPECVPALRVSRAESVDGGNGQSTLA